MSNERIPAALERAVRSRAGERCEYCRLAQEGQEATFHVDHVHPRRLDGPTTFENLALACVSCSLRKGAAIESVDPESGAAVPLFNPRVHTWHEHFELSANAMVRGRTPEGRATLERLRMNRVLAVAIRREEMERGRYP